MYKSELVRNAFLVRKHEKAFQARKHQIFVEHAFETRKRDRFVHAAADAFARKKSHHASLARGSTASCVYIQYALMREHDPATADHEARVAWLAQAIAEQLGWRGKRLDFLYLGALFHDVGKLRIKNTLLGQRTPLTDCQRALVRSHVPAGVAMIKNLRALWVARPIIHYHHQWVDGSKGYPALRGPRFIPMAARIVAVADVVDAIAYRDAYRDGRGLDAALAVIVEETGTHFDPAVAQALCAVFAQEPPSLGGPPSDPRRLQYARPTDPVPFLRRRQQKHAYVP